jgi:rod shape-determining protein MreD
MADHIASGRRWRMRIAYLLIALGVVYLQLLPFQTMPRGWAGPDLLMVLTVAWATRRPEYVPVLAVGVVFLLADLILLRAPGLLAAIMVIARQTLRRQSLILRDAPFPTEWATAAATLVAIMLAERLALTIFLVDRAPLGLSVMQLFMNILFYPLVVMASHLILGLRKSAPGDDDTLAGAT